MKFFIVLSALIALAVAAPPSDVTVLRNDVDHVDPTGYKFALVFFGVHLKWQKTI